MPLLKLNTLDQSYKTILCMDGGGMRGLLTGDPYSLYGLTHWLLYHLHTTRRD